VTPAPHDPSHDVRRKRLVGLLVLGVAVVLLLSSVSWFGSDRPAVGFGQVILGSVLAAVGAVLYRRSRGA
jgi:drug/metabolite transporter (DMT)-like permease